MNFSINNIANGTANIIWAIFGGFLFAIFYWALAVLYCISLIGIPFGIQLFKVGMFVLQPFGYCVEDEGGVGSGCLNVIWIIIGGLELAIAHLLVGIIFCITLIGIPFGLQHFRIAWLALVPFGKSIEKN